MNSRFRTYGMDSNRSPLHREVGTVKPCRCAKTAPLVSCLLFVALFLFAGIASIPAWATTPAGTVIVNTAGVGYTDGPFSGPIAGNSNTITITTVAFRTPSIIEFLKYAPQIPGVALVNVAPCAYRSGSDPTAPLVASPPPVPAGLTTPIDLTKPVPLASGAVYHGGEPIFVRVTDPDQNLDPIKAETILTTIIYDATGDVEVLRITETGPDTGVFVGYIQSITSAVATPYSGTLSVSSGSTVRASYSDILDGNDSVACKALVDPFGIFFDSSTGKPINGVIVTLIDTTTGKPATVFGDDGASTFPATITSGGTASDSSGINYKFPPGGFRFPFINPGAYKFQIITPPGYTAPSTVADATLQNLPGGPFTLVTPGSRLEPFTIIAGPAFHLDIPLDPQSAVLWLRKSVDRDSVAIGDFLSYQLDLLNSDAVLSATGVVITDTLPLGFRYRPGSTKLNGVAVPDPAILPDGRILRFAIGDLATKATATVRFVVEVAAGARPGIATNRAIALSAAGIASNQATATVQVRTDFMNSRSIIMGKVMDSICSEPYEEKPAGVPGIRIFLEDGTYVVTDKNGMYHFEGVVPGTHVVQMDLTTVPEKYELLFCEENSRFAGTPYSQFVDLQGGTLWRADFHLGLKPAVTGEAVLELLSVLKKTESGENPSDTVEYSVPIRLGAVPTHNLRLTILLPDGCSYQAGTSSLNTFALPDPVNRENVLTYSLGDLPGNWEGTVKFMAAVPLVGRSGELTTRALLTFDTPAKKNERTPLADNILVRKSVEEHRSVPDLVIRPHFAVLSADLSEQDKNILNRLIDDMKQIGPKHITVVGHTDSDPILGRGRAKFTDNYALSQARAETVGHYIAEGLKLSPEQVTYVGKGADEPITSNETAEGRALNRRVKLVVQTEKHLVSGEISNKKERSGVKTVATVGLRPGEKWVDAEVEKISADAKNMPEYSAAWLETAAAGVAWLWPPEEYHPPIPNVILAVKQDPRKTLKLFLNGAEVDAIYLDGTVKREDNTVAVSTWRGVHVADGDNLFEAVQFGADGIETSRLTRVIHYSTPPVKAEFDSLKSHLIADGKTPVVIAVRLTDKDGHPAREGVIGEYTLDPPFVSRQRADELKKSPLTAPSTDRLKYRIVEDGVALIELQPTASTGEAVVRFNLASGTQVVRAWLTPDYRDWILVGLGEGTVGYNTVAGHMENLREAGLDEQLYESGRLAFYAKGRVKGEWLLTMAYDSAKETRDMRNASLFQTIDPNTYYMLYGDGSQQLYDAASARKLYLKIERDQFYALFGDFNTGLTVTELSRYSRSLNGFKSEYQDKNVEVNVFGTETGQAFVKDELRGDGTSGLYRLSRRNMVFNSEKVTIETRDRFHSEIIIESRTLSRFVDYSIDFDAGTLFFKEPILSRDENFNPRYIVVDYEILNTGTESLTYGGRAGAKLLAGNLRTGVSYIHEGQGNSNGNLYGLDAAYKIGAGTTLKAEVAQTDSELGGIAREGNAYLAELQHDSPRLQGKLYVREQDVGFGLGQQKGSETGTRKLGGAATFKLTDIVGLDGQTYRQYNLATGGVQDVVEAKTTFTSAPYSAHLGLLYANDLLGDGTNKTSQQLTMGASWLTMNKRLTLLADHDQSIGADSAADFPTRTTFGADFKFTERLTLFARQEITSGAGADTNSTIAGMKASLWEGGAINTSLGQNLNENSERIFALFGLKQTWKINDTWSVDGGLDRSQTIRKQGHYQFNINVPPASGENQDFTAVSLGTTLTAQKWSWNSRMEVRVSEVEDKWGILTAYVGEPREGWGWSARYHLYDTQAFDGSGKTSGDLRLGLVYRPLFTRWIILDRLDFLFDRQHGGTTATTGMTGTSLTTDSQRVVNNLSVNFKPDSKLQISLHYGAKYVQETIDSQDYSGYTDMFAIEGRYDLTKEWDVGLRGSVLHSWNSDQFSFSAGPSVGYNVVKNAWISLGYNITGFTDKDFSAADYTAQGPFIRFRFKFDQNSVREAANWLNNN